MNGPESDIKFVPKQAIAPTPQLYDELVSDSMLNLAKASVAVIPGLAADDAVFHDNGCGTGAGTEAIISTFAAHAKSVTIKGTDINEDALKVYRESAAREGWPAEAINMDSNQLKFDHGTFNYSISNALLFVLPNDGIDAVKEVYRTLKPGGKAVFNSWAYVPNMGPLQAASKATRPDGSPLPRDRMEKWTDPSFLKGVMEQGGFQPDQITMHQAGVQTTTAELNRFANMLWSFIGGTTSVGWLESDEENWDKAIEIIKQELKKTDGYVDLEGGKASIRFIANIAVVSK